MGRSGRRPTRAQNSSRVVDGCWSNQSSNTCEPVTTMLRGLEMVQLDGLPLLHLVPHDHLLRREVQLPLARQVIPARNREDVPDAELHRRAGQIELCGLEDDHRRQHDDVGAMLAEVVVIDRGAARGLLEDVEARR